MGRPTKNHKTIRLNLELSEVVRKRLEELKTEIEADSLADVIRRALALYDHVWTKHKEGFEVTLKNAHETRIVEFY